jgi:glutathione synthase/RimK-type ligase-like ATP-grasp enzyme
MRLLTFHGPSLYCTGASVVLDFEGNSEILSGASDATISFLLEISQLEGREKSEFVWEGADSSSNNLTVRLFANAWASLCIHAGCDVFLYGVKQVENSYNLFASCTDFEVAESTATYLNRILTSGIEIFDPAPKVIGSYIQSIQHLIPGTATKHLVATAWKLGVPYRKIFGPHMIVLGAGRNSMIFNRQAPGDDGHHGTLISRDKQRSKLLFVKLGLPVASSRLVKSSDPVGNIPDHFFPCVVKPIDGEQGRGVYVNLRGHSDLTRALQKAATITNRPLMVEQQILGDDVRLLVCRGELLAAVKRAKPVVIGDGATSIANLVRIENLKRSTSLHEQKQKPQISLNEEAVDFLLTQGFTLEHIPGEGEKVNVRGTPHGTHGGDMIDVTNEVHPEIISLAILASERIDAALCGLDYISSDHTKSPAETGGVFLEINTFPGLKPIELLADRDRLNCLQKILGKAAIPAEILVFIGSSTTDFIGLKDSAIDEHTAWYCEGRVGLGRFIDRKTTANISVPIAYERCVLDSRADRLAFFLTSDDVRRHGLPCNKVDKVVVLNPGTVSEDIRDLLKRVSNIYDEMSSQSL